MTPNFDFCVNININFDFGIDIDFLNPDFDWTGFERR